MSYEIEITRELPAWLMAQCRKDGEIMSWGQVLKGWRESREFRIAFLNFWRNVPFAAYRWETPPLTVNRFSQPFEFVILDSPYLQTAVDMVSFRSHFANAAANVKTIDFMNLGKDARLIVPVPIEPPQACAHLASFIREAPEANGHDLLYKIGEIVPQEIGDDPRWLSTAGGGVAYLHVRIDHRPKYYGHTPYRRFP